MGILLSKTSELSKVFIRFEKAKFVSGENWGDLSSHSINHSWKTSILSRLLSQSSTDCFSRVVARPDKYSKTINFETDKFIIVEFLSDNTKTFKLKKSLTDG